MDTKYKIDTRAPNSQEIQKLIKTQLQKNGSFSEQEIESILKANTIQKAITRKGRFNNNTNKIINLENIKGYENKK